MSRRLVVQSPSDRLGFFRVEGDPEFSSLEVAKGVVQRRLEALPADHPVLATFAAAKFVLEESVDDWNWTFVEGDRSISLGIPSISQEEASSIPRLRLEDLDEETRQAFFAEYPEYAEAK